MPISNHKWNRAKEEEPIQEQVLNFLHKNPNQAYTAKEISERLEPNYSAQTEEVLVAIIYDLVLQSLVYEGNIEMKRIGGKKDGENYYKSK